MIGANKGKKMGPFFAETETYKGFSQEDQIVEHGVWDNHDKVDAMKSLWGKEAADPWGSRPKWGPPIPLMAEAAGGKGMQPSPFTGVRMPLSAMGFQNYMNMATDPQSFIDHMLSKAHPKVIDPPAVEPKFELFDTSEEIENGETGSEKFTLDEPTEAWGFDPIPKARMEPMFSQSSSDIQHLYPFPVMSSGGRKFSLDSLSSDGMGVRTPAESTTSEMSLNASEDFDFELLDRFQKELTLADERMSRPRPGTTRADIDDFSRKFGYTGQVRKSLMYRPRKGKYRCEFK